MHTHAVPEDLARVLGYSDAAIIMMPHLGDDMVLLTCTLQPCPAWEEDRLRALPEYLAS